MSKWTRKRIVIPAAGFFLAGALACGSAPDTGTAAGEAEPGAAPAAAEAGEQKATDGVYKFGEVVKFKDGSTLTVGKPTKFTRDQYAAGGEDSKVFLKFKTTFSNGTKEVFDPALTSGAASAGGQEGVSVFQEGLDAPDNKVLPGKSVTWWMGYGFATDKDVQLEVNVGFLDYGTVIFTG